MKCGYCGLNTNGLVCGNPGCKSNQGQYQCPECNLISIGTVCSNPGCNELTNNRYYKAFSETLEVDLSWGELLEELDAATACYLKQAKKQPRMVLNLMDSGTSTYFIDRPCGAHWLWLCSNKSGPKLMWVPAVVMLRYGSSRIEVTMRSGVDVRVHFPDTKFSRTDLRYFEIGEIFAEMGRDVELANEILARIGGRSIQNFGPYDSFIDAMIILMMGVEASRNWATCATSLMLLELIGAGAQFGESEQYTFVNAFHHPYKKWTTGALYGGTYPMATHDTGKGNLVDRGKIIRAKGKEWEDVVALNPQRHAVVFRELRVTRDWLFLTETRHGFGHLTPYFRIIKLLKQYLS